MGAAQGLQFLAAATIGTGLVLLVRLTRGRGKPGEQRSTPGEPREVEAAPDQESQAEDLVGRTPEPEAPAPAASNDRKRKTVTFFGHPSKRPASSEEEETDFLIKAEGPGKRSFKQRFSDSMKLRRKAA